MGFLQPIRDERDDDEGEQREVFLRVKIRFLAGNFPMKNILIDRTRQTKHHQGSDHRPMIGSHGVGKHDDER